MDELSAQQYYNMSHSLKLIGHWFKSGKAKDGDKLLELGPQVKDIPHGEVLPWGFFQAGEADDVCGISAPTLFLIDVLCPHSLTQSGVGVHCPLEDALERRLRSRRGCDASWQ